MLVLVLVSIWLNPTPTEGTEQEIARSKWQEGLAGMEALAGIVFAFQVHPGGVCSFVAAMTCADPCLLRKKGQSIFLEIMAEMKDSREFPKAGASRTSSQTCDVSLHQCKHTDASSVCEVGDSCHTHTHSLTHTHTHHLLTHWHH